MSPSTRPVSHSPVSPPAEPATTIENQPSSSVQLLNNTSKEHLHIFLQVSDMNQRWKKLGGTGSIHDPVDWGAPGMAWNPAGALKLAESIVPAGGSTPLQIPDGNKVFRIFPIEMKTDSITPLPAGTNPTPHIVEQWPCLIEGGKDVVADASAVDGINFAQHYELTTDKGKKAYTTFIGNPCSNIGDKYQLDVGCHNPAKIECSGPTCDCKADQNCKFNACSEKLFDIPQNLQKYETSYDGGNPNHAPVKTFINKTSNLKDETPLKKFAVAVNGTGDFHTYAYDYNDPGASPYLRNPYKIRVTYSDL